MQKSRKRRAAPTDIYPQCKVSNTCPPDIVNKLENNTLADKILKYGSAGVFFGSLGIGTGRGTGGSTGYIPLGSGGGGVRVGSRVTTVRPSLPTSSLNPGEGIPVDAVDPLGPALIPLREFPLTPSVVEDPEPILPPRFPSIVDDPGPVIPGTSEPDLEITIETPKVTTDGSAAVLEVTPETRPPTVLSRSQYSNPAFEVSLTSSAGAGETSASDHIFVDAHSGGSVVGDQIPLLELGTSRSTVSFSTSEVQETSFFTSTPRSDPVARPRQLYGRRVQQVPIQDPRFLTQPRSLVTFENPAFVDSVDLIFDQDIDVAQAAPVEEFRDIVTLTKPLYGKTPGGGVRISRLGQKASMKTRSGLRIGPQSHFYYDISSIGQEPPIELLPLEPVAGEQSGESIVSSGMGDFEVISLSSSTLEPPVADEDLLDHIEEVAEDLQLIIGDRNQQPISVPGPAKTPAKVFPGFDDVYVIHAGDDSDYPLTVIPTDNPSIIIEVRDSSGDYYLHPALLKRKRRKRPSF
uniref:Minor capsid protein L2 n=1 Tax=Enhydra lutris kenyoni papillomavirus 2 TaxID=3073258 RepID=A0AA51ZUA0_9PAPI|nr:L2 [Enhydra lutris kenyoni papillomavirus 2]